MKILDPKGCAGSIPALGTKFLVRPAGRFGYPSQRHELACKRRQDAREALRSLNELITTKTELRAIAADASIGLRSILLKG